MTKETSRSLPLILPEEKRSNRSPIVLIVDRPQRISPMIHELEREGFNTSISASLPEAVEFTNQYPTDIVVADTDEIGVLPTDLKVLRKPFIVTESVDDPEEFSKRATEALDIGAENYLKKPISPGLLPAYIRAILRNSSIDEQLWIVNGVKGVTVDHTNRKVFIDGQQVRLSETQFELLGFISLYPDSITRTYEIIDKVWGLTQDFDLSLSNLRSVVSSIRRKLNQVSDGSGNVVETVKGAGYKFRTSSGE